eukprot:TRINITY_DN4546_c0_g3_i1.p1 TRINITY_DN4546_c0_g3~~TRINITY_DN4546_c0_g3_i1.p1  ORF type:complete len:1390 (-),score=369.29 TRINITY_DN4546_c0_g3_i1:38-4207(-)
MSSTDGKSSQDSIDASLSSDAPSMKHGQQSSDDLALRSKNDHPPMETSKSAPVSTVTSPTSTPEKKKGLFGKKVVSPFESRSGDRSKVTKSRSESTTDKSPSSENGKEGKSIVGKLLKKFNNNPRKAEDRTDIYVQPEKKIEESPSEEERQRAHTTSDANVNSNQRGSDEANRRMTDNPSSPREEKKKKEVVFIKKPKSNAEDRLVAHLLIIGVGKTLQPLSAKQSEKNMDLLSRVYKAEQLYSFPQVDKEFPPHLWMFCLPRGVQIETRDRGQTCFPFVLTSATGKRMYAYNITFWEPCSPEFIRDNLLPPKTAVDPKNLPSYFVPKCVCIISHHPHYAVFREWLVEFHKRIFNMKLTISVEQMMINFAMQVPAPPPRNLKVKFNIGEKLVSISRPPITSLPMSDFPMMYAFKVLSLRNLLTVFKCLLVEQKILLHSKHVTLLAYTCETLQLLMFPFEWPHVFVPNLPEVLMDFAFSPTPFIIGALTDFVLPIVDYIKQDVVIVDLDLDQISLPEEAFQLVELPEPESSILMQDLQKFFQSDILSLDNPQFNPYALSRNETSMATTNCYIQSAFLKFFVSIFRDYRQFMMYIRCLESPVAIFDIVNFLNLRPDAMPFFESFMETQAFSMFLEEHNRPKESIFNDWIDNAVYNFTIEDVISKLAPNQASKERFPEVVIVPEPKKLTKENTVEYTVFPVLDEFQLDEGYSLHLAEISKKAPKERADPRKQATPGPTPRELIVEEALETKQREHEVQEKVVRELSLKLVDPVVSEAPLSASEETQLLEFFKFEYGRKAFASALAEERKDEGRLSDASFTQTAEMVNSALREAASNLDFVAPRILVPLTFKYHHIADGAEDHLYNRVRKQDIWQNADFWEKAFFDSSSKQIRELYGGDVRKILRQAPNYTTVKRKELAAKELDEIFRLLSKFAFNMVNLGVAPDTIRRWMLKMCSMCSIEEDQAKILNQLLSNMSRANEMSKAEEEPLIRMGGFKKGDRYLPVGLTGRKEKSEGPELLFNFIEEKTEGKPNPLKKVHQTFKNNWFQKKRTVNQDMKSEEHDDYTVKTFIGHTEGVLSAVLTDMGPISGSCDGTIRVWNTFTAKCVSTMTGHTGWVNLLEIYDDGKLVSGSYDHSLKLWDINKCTKMHSMRGHKGSISCLAVKDARSILSGSYDNSINMWDTRHHTKSMLTFLGHAAPITCLVLEGNTMVTGSRDATLRVWDLRTGKSMKILKGHTDWVKSCRLQGDQIFSGSCDSTIRRWALNGEVTSSVLLEGHSGTVNALLWTDNSLVSASADSTVKVWSLNDTSPSATLQSHSDEVMDLVTFQTKVVSSSYDRSIKIWDLKLESLLCTLQGHGNRISSLRSYGNQILSTSWDNTVKLWQFPIDWRPRTV